MIRALPLHIMFGESSGIPQGVPRKLLDKKNRQISNRVPFIHFELPGRLSGGRMCEMIYLTSVSPMGVFATKEFDEVGWKMLRLWLADWMFCNHRSAQPCLHTFFIVFRRFSPHRFHTFLVNMIRHPHGIHPPVLYTFVIAIFRPSSEAPMQYGEDLFFWFWLRGYVPPLMPTCAQMYATRPPSVFWVTLGDYIDNL